MNLRDTLSQLVDYLSLGETTMSAWQVQESIERAIAKTRVRTLRGNWAGPNTMLVHISSEAYDVLRPVERQVLEEIEEHLPKQLEHRGWNPHGGLRVALAVDPELHDLQIRVSAADRDVTPNEPATDDRTIRATATQTSQVVVSEIGPGAQQWTIPTERRFIMGRRPKQHGNIKADVEFDNPVLSRMHVGLRSVRLRDGATGLEVFDMGSQNGTFVDGKLIEKRTEILVRHGQVIRLGGRQGVALRVSATTHPDATQLDQPEDR